VSERNTASVIGQREGNIYFVRGLQEIVLARLSKPEGHTTREVWHQRIAHRSLNHQAAIPIAKSVTGFDLGEDSNRHEMICGICAEGKQGREQLTGERSKSRELLHTSHSDVCGPIATTGLIGERYFATFIDE